MFEHYFKTDCFEYRLVRVERNIEGWKIKALPGVQKFECPGEIDGYKVVSLDFTFIDYKYKTIDISGMDTSNVITMNHTFESSAINVIDLSTISLDNVQYMQNTFDNCYAEKIIFGDKNRLEKLNKTIGMFHNCTNLIQIDGKEVRANGIYNVLDLFDNCDKLRDVDFRNLKTNILNLSLNYNQKVFKLNDARIIIAYTAGGKSIMKKCGYRIMEASNESIDKVLEKSIKVLQKLRLLEDSNTNICILLKN